MATFSVDSQNRTTPVSVSTRIFDKAFFFSTIIIFVVGGIWATERVLIYLVDKDIAVYQAKTTQGLAGADAQAINQLDDFVSRSNLVEEYAKQKSIPDLLAVLEKTTIPQVKLTEYEYDQKKGSTTIAGVTTDYRFIAEQLLRYRQEESLKTMRVESTERSESGELKFSFIAEMAPEAEIVPAAPPL